MAPEVQGHGFTFETWVRETFFDNYRAQTYTDEWDVAVVANVNHGDVPVSIKTAKYGSSIGLGDALRQFRIREDFLLIAGFWRQEGSMKRIVNIVAAPINVALWRSLWAPISEEDLQELDAVIKNRALTSQQAREEAQRIKSQPTFAQSLITVNPKIDSKTQRRLQCSLSFSTLFTTVAPNAVQSQNDSPTLFGVPAIEAFLSDPRTFNRTNQSHT